MLIDLNKKLEDKKNIEELKECLEYFKSLKEVIKSLDCLTDEMINDVISVTEAKGEINFIQLACIMETQQRFTDASKDLLKIFNELNIVKYTE